MTQGITKKTAEIVTSLLIILIALVTLYDSFGRGVGWASDGPQSGYFPARIAGIMLLAGLFVLYKALKLEGDTLIVDRDQITLIAKIFIPLVVYVFLIGGLTIAKTTIIPAFGIYLASAVFLAGLMIWLGNYIWWKALLSGIFTAILAFVVFETWFRVPLPKGFIEKVLGF